MARDPVLACWRCGWGVSATRLGLIIGRLNAFEEPSLSGLAGQNAPTPLLIFHAYAVIFERVLGRGIGANYPASPDSLRAVPSTLWIWQGSKSSRQRAPLPSSRSFNPDVTMLG